MAELRFCLCQYQHLPLPELRSRWLRAEALGFDVLWNVDTVVEPDTPGAMMFDGPGTLVQMALATSKIRVGTLVSSMYFRSPVTLAKATMTVDHLSNGRVELALGVGDPSAGVAAAGAFTDMVGRYRSIGINEFVLYWPRTRAPVCRAARSAAAPGSVLSGAVTRRGAAYT